MPVCYNYGQHLTRPHFPQWLLTIILSLLFGIRCAGPEPLPPHFEFSGRPSALPVPAASTSEPSRQVIAKGVDSGIEPDPCSNYREANVVAVDEPTTFLGFTRALAAQLDQLDLGAVRAAYQTFTRQRGLDPETPGLFTEYARLRILFEATRDGGYWRLRWDITNQEPSAAKIWRAWQIQPLVETFGHALATAECDELSALYALLARRIGIKRVGLFYPTWNHTIAAWVPVELPGKQRLVLVPTTQIFLGCSDTFDTTAFKTQMTSIEPYPRWDIRDSSPIPSDTARFLLEQIRVYGPASLDLQALLRARRAHELKSSVGKCAGYRADLGKRLEGRLSCADRRALRHFAVRELQRPAMSDNEVLEFLMLP